MKYIVMEIQTLSNGEIANLVTSYSDRGLAEQAYHTILASAAVSAIPVHAAVLMTNEGYVISRGVYKRTVEEENNAE